jgi:hypothetical protein
LEGREEQPLELATREEQLEALARGEANFEISQAMWTASLNSG